MKKTRVVFLTAVSPVDTRPSMEKVGSSVVSGGGAARSGQFEDDAEKGRTFLQMAAPWTARMASVREKRDSV
jgi:hypothetical protein